MLCMPAAVVAEQGETQQALLKLDIEQINLSDTEQLGWVGATYQWQTFEDIFIGGSLYGGITGERGGFFSLGTSLTWRHQLSDTWLIDAGLYLGGGGGGGANRLVGGGLTFRPHIDVLYRMKDGAVGISASHVRFPTGTVSSNQVGLTFTHQHDFFLADTQQTQQTFEKGGFGFDRIRGVAAIYHGVLRRAGNSNERATMVGARADHWLNPTMYWSAEIVGAAGGELGGYADYLAALGVEYPVLQDRLFVGGRVGMGMGGGGGALTQGGLLGKVALNAAWYMTDDIAVTLEGGYLVAPLGDMRVKYASFELSTDLDKPFRDEYERDTTMYEWQAGVFNYHTVVPSHSASSIPFAASEITVNRFFTDSAYYGVHMMYAAKGGTYGGYGAAFVSLGYSVEIGSDISLSVEVAAGGGGGGATAVGGGALYMGNIYADYRFTENLGLRLGLGRMRALQGGLDTTVSEAMLTYRYQVLERH